MALPVRCPRDRLLITWLDEHECYDGVELWEAARGKRLGALGKDACPNTAVLSADGSQVITQTMGQDMVRYDGRFQIDKRWPIVANQDRTTLLSPDGARLYARDSDEVGVLYDTGSQELVQTVAGFGTPIAFSPDGSLLALVQGEANVALIEVGLLRSLPGLAGALRVAAAQGPPRFFGQKSPDGRRQLKISDSGTVFIQPVDGSQPRLSLIAERTHNDRSFTRSGDYAVTWSLADTPAGPEAREPVVASAQVFDATTGVLLLKQTGEAAARLVDSLHPNGTRVRTVNGAPWELIPSVPDPATLKKALPALVPLRFAGESLVPAEKQ